MRGNFSVHYGYHTDPTNDVILDFVQRNPLLQDAARIGHSSGRALKLNASAIAAAAFLIAEAHDVPTAEEFFVASRTKRYTASARDPLKILAKVVEGGELRTQVQVAAALVLTFNRRRSNKTATQNDLIWLAGSEFPQVAAK